jgi:RHS repeat-associated protein
VDTLIEQVEDPFRFPGQYYDTETGLHYNYYRTYNPGIGRYITPDPIGLEGGINLFTYVRSNPVTFADPLGLRDWGIGWGIGVEGHFMGGMGFDSYFCCDLEGKKWRVRTWKQCKGIALNVPWGKPKEFSAALTGGIQFSYLNGKDCPDGFENAEYTELGYGPIEVGIPRPNPIVDPGKGGSCSGTTIGFGVGGGFKYTRCKYKVWDKQVVGCCSL